MAPAQQEPEASVAELAERLRTDGYTVLRGVLSPELCDALREHVLRTAEEAQKLGRSDLFGDIHERDHRTDLKLDLCPPVLESLNAYGERCGPILKEVFGGLSRIVELAAITSTKGAAVQRVHADTMHGVTRFLQSDVALHTTTRQREDEDSEDEGAQEDLTAVIRAVATDTALIYTSLIALQDVTSNMGPTLVWPGTHTVEHHATLWNKGVGAQLTDAEADQCFGTMHRKMTLSKGDLVLYDSRVMHCGGANKSDKARSVLCISTMGPGLRPDGSTWTILPSLRNRLMLHELPLAASLAHAQANTAASEEVVLPPPPASRARAQGGGAEPGVEAEGLKAIPPLEEWDAAVLCTLCKRWRPCKQDEAPRLTGMDNGFACPVIGFSCMQEQVYTDQEIDALF